MTLCIFKTLITICFYYVYLNLPIFFPSVTFSDFMVLLRRVTQLTALGNRDRDRERVSSSSQLRHIWPPPVLFTLSWHFNPARHSTLPATDKFFISLFLFLPSSPHYFFLSPFPHVPCLISHFFPSFSTSSSSISPPHSSPFLYVFHYLSLFIHYLLFHFSPFSSFFLCFTFFHFFLSILFFLLSPFLPPLRHSLLCFLVSILPSLSSTFLLLS